MKKIYLINGPNLNLIGERETDIYGSTSFEEFFEILIPKFSMLDIECFQSNIEGEIIEKIQEVSKKADGIVINPAGYSHTSVAIADAIRAVDTKVVEVHISNIHAREEYRHSSITGAACNAVISGFGLQSYDLAIQSFLQEK